MRHILIEKFGQNISMAMKREAMTNEIFGIELREFGQQRGGIPHIIFIFGEAISTAKNGNTVRVTPLCCPINANISRVFLPSPFK